MPRRERTGFWGLLSLGISGGIVPCVDALIGLLFAISLGKLVWGLIILSASHWDLPPYWLLSVF